MNQGDMSWYTFRAPDKRRPVLLLTRTSAVRYLTSLTVAPITRTVRGIPTQIVLTDVDGLPQLCAINRDHIQTVPKSSVGGYITQLQAAKLREVLGAIQFAPGFETLG